jgi:regulator of sirC expression with transglutaminase-like and TPR domain
VNDSLIARFTDAARSPDQELAPAALMIAEVEYPRIEAGSYLDRLDMLGHEARARLADAPIDLGETPSGADPESYARVVALNDYLFRELRFVGNAAHYEDPRNSFLNEVIDRRTGIPISLALVYIEVARRAGLHVEGVNFPGHFLLRCPARRSLQYSADLIIDPFHQGALLSEGACRQLLRRHAGDEAVFDPELLAHATKAQILARMLLNLKRLYVRMHSFPQARDITALLLAADPAATTELRDRGLLAYHLNDFSSALRDLQAYLLIPRPQAVDEDERDDHEQIWEHVKTLRRRVASMN